MQPLFMPRMMGRLSPVQMVFDLKFEGGGRGVHVISPCRGASGGPCFKWALRAVREGVWHLRGRVQSAKLSACGNWDRGCAEVEAGGRGGRRALGMPLVPGLRVVRWSGRWGRPGLRVAAAREVNTGEKLHARRRTALEMLETPVRAGFQRSVCSQRIYPPIFLLDSRY